MCPDCEGKTSIGSRMKKQGEKVVSCPTCGKGYIEEAGETKKDTEPD